MCKAVNGPKSITSAPMYSNSNVLDPNKTNSNKRTVPLYIHSSDRHSIQRVHSMELCICSFLAAPHNTS